jgi:predicted small lipoprotein YifL
VALVAPVCLLLSAAAAGCGQKGPLKLPPATPASGAASAPAR